MAGEQHKVDWHKLVREALTAPGNMTGVYDRFHDYSITNMLLFRLQGIHEPVASASRWKQLGRRVIDPTRRNEVIVPRFVYEPAADEHAEDEKLEKKRERVARLVGFNVVRAVFALSDTEGEELPSPKPHGWDLITALAKLGVREVPFDSTNGNLQGWSQGTEFAINPIAVNRPKTIFHELGHIVLGHTLPSLHAKYAQHRGPMEGEAEITALIVMNEVGLLDDETASHMRGYVQHWMQDETFTEQAARRIFRAAEAILRAGRVTQDTAQEGAASS